LGIFLGCVAASTGVLGGVVLCVLYVPTEWQRFLTVVLIVIALALIFCFAPAEHPNRPLDILFFGDYDWLEVRGRLLREGYCEPLGDFLADNPDIRALYSEKQWKTVSWQGVNYLFPCYPTYNKLRYAFRPDGAGGGLEGLTGTTAQLAALWASATEDAPLFWAGDTQQLLPFELLMGVALSHETGRAVNPFSDEGYGELIRVLNELYITDRVVVTFGGDTLLETDEYAAYVVGPAFGFQDWDPPETYLQHETKLYMPCAQPGLCVRSESLHKEKAFAVLKEVYTNPELVNLLIYGEPEADYILKDGSPYD
jgi:hypothetical protein